MKARLLSKSGAAIIVAVAGLLLAWLSGELFAPSKASLYVRLAVLVATAAVVVLVLHDFQAGDERDGFRYKAQECVERMPGLAWATDATGQRVADNASSRTYLAAGDTVETAIHPGDSERALGLWARSLQTGEDFRSTHRVRDREGVYRWFRAHATPQRGPKEDIIGWIGSLIDIDEVMQSERDLEAKTYQLQQLVDATPALIWTARADGFADFLNQRWLDYTGLTSESAMGTGWLACIHEGDLEKLADYWRMLLETGKSGSIEARLRGSDGEYRWFNFKAEPLRDSYGNIYKWLGSNIDVDSLKKVEEELRARERDLVQLIDAVPAMLCILTSDGEPSYVNNRLMDFVGIASIEDLDAPGTGRLESAAHVFVHPDDRDRLQEILRRSFATGEPYTLLHRVRRADGVYRWMEARGEALRDDKGRILKWYSVNIDVDDFQKADDALRKRERELQLLIDTIPSGVWCLTPEGEPEYINKRLETYYGRQVDRTQPVETTRLDRALGRLMHPDDLPALQQNLGRSLKTGESFAMRYRNRRADGVYRWVDARAEPYRDEDGRIVRWYGVTVDIDDGIKAQEALRIARERLSKAAQTSNLAELSAAIAHEVNQPLAAVVSNSHACQRWLSAVPPNHEQAQLSADRIIRNSMRATEIIGRVRDLFRHKASEKSLIDVNEVIGEVHQILIDEIVSKRVVVTMELDSTLPTVLADRVQIQQLLMNLIRNGMDALLADAGPQKLVIIESRLDGETMIRVDVRDTGAGMTEPDRIFEPFFTTKEEGMGIGLAICRSIVEAHAGSIWATSNEPRGTVFSFTLPIQSS